MPVTPHDWLAHLLTVVRTLETETLPVAAAHGRTLAADAHARHDLPLWDNSAMDGYALRASDTATATAEAPVTLAVIGEVLAGSPDDPALAAGTAVRIMTGAPVPSAADAVIAFERTLDGASGDPWSHDTVRLAAPVAAGSNVRQQGEDTPAGTVIARAGDPLTAARLSALAAAGIAELVVHRLPRVAVIVTGAELQPPGRPLARGEIAESNSLLVAGMLRECGIDAVSVHRISDDAETLDALLAELSPGCDAIITTGGVGPGSHDIVRLLLEREPEVTQVRVAVRPGQPQCAGRLASGPLLFALPGNPVSAACSFELFVRPSLLAMQGRREIHRRRLRARAAVGWRGVTGRLQVVPVVLSEDSTADEASAAALRCAPAVNPRSISHAVGGHGAAQGYALVEAERGDVVEGELVDVIVVAP